MANTSLLLEFQFESCTRPIDNADSKDTRCLSIGFREIVGHDETGQVVCRADFSTPDAPLPELACGISPSEPALGGAWCNGQRCCLLFELPEEKSVHSIELRTYIFDCIAPTAITRIRCNGTDLGNFSLSPTTTSFELPSNIGRLATEQNWSSASNASPDISVIIPNFNRPDLTKKAVLTLLSSLERASVEIIVVDNGSSQKQFSELAELGLPIRLIRLDEKRSFGEVNNFAAELARGKYLLLLNNDAFVTHGLPDLLLQVLEDYSHVGAAGPIFRFPNGMLQEAGSVVLADSRTIQRGMNDPMFDVTALPELDSVGYISAACLMLRVNDFRSLGGFDPVFEPAYFEDADLCLRLGLLGKSIALVKNALCFHINNSTSKSPEIWKAISVGAMNNQLRFASRWGDPFATKNAAMRPTVIPFEIDSTINEVHRIDQKTCLIYTTDLPLPDRRSRSLLTTGLALSRTAETWFGSQTAYSSLRLKQIASRLDLPRFSMKVVTPSPQAETGFDFFIYSSRTLFPAHPGIGKRNIHHCTYPAVTSALTDSEMQSWRQNLLGYERVVTDSSFTRNAYLKVLQKWGGAKIPVNIIYPPIDSALVNELERKENLILGVASFSVLDVAHETTLAAFAKIKSTIAGKDWRLVLCGDLAGYQGAASFDKITQAAQAVGATVLLDPPPDVMRDLLHRAKIYISVGGLGFRVEDHSWISDFSGAPIAEAVAAGCFPIVHSIGPEQEICEHLGIGSNCQDSDELVDRLVEATLDHGVAGLSTHVRLRACSFSWNAYYESWQRIVDGSIGSEIETASDPQHRTAKVTKGNIRRPQSSRKNALVVIGGHRSGTSAIARTLALAGARLPARLMEAKLDNPAGFWEPQEIAALNERILSSFKSGWDDIFSAIECRQLDLLNTSLMSEAREQIRLDYDNSNLIVLKEPRISVLVPLWDGALMRESYEPHYVIMLRSPFEVADSLQARNNIPLAKGLLLWASYLIAAERDTRGKSRIFVSYESLLEDSKRVLDRIESSFGIALPKRTLESAIDIDHFLTQDLHHHRASNEKQPAEQLRAIAELYRHALSGCEGTGIDESKFSQAAEWLDSLMNGSDQHSTSLKLQHECIQV